MAIGKAGDSLKQYRVILYDREEAFASALMNYVNQKADIPIMIMSFTRLPDMDIYLHRHRNDLLILEWCADTAEFEKESAMPILWTVTGTERDMPDELPEKQFQIMKYSPASAYVRLMVQILSRERAVRNAEGSCQCVAVYSPLGRCGKTSFAKAFCGYYAAAYGDRGMRCLYLGWEEFAQETDEENRMEEVLYYIKQRAENLSMKIKALATTEQGFDCVWSAGTYQELREMSKEDIQWFLQDLRAEGYYHWVVADIGSASFSDFGVLEAFDVIYLPYLQDPSSMQKITAFYSTLRGQGIWEGIAGHAYPVLWNGKSFASEDIRALEEDRKNDALASLIRGEKDVGDRTDLQGDRILYTGGI